jgi:hypothetical protein
MAKERRKVWALMSRCRKSSKFLARESLHGEGGT